MTGAPLHRFLYRLAHTLAPRLCPCCREALLPGEGALCIKCLLNLPRITHQDLLLTSLPDALANAPAPPGLMTVWFRYRPDEPQAAIVRAAKYHGRPGLARALGREFGRELAANNPNQIERTDLLLPVPMFWLKEWARGYNQSRQIALGISDATGITVADNLHATRPHGTQTHRSRTKRLLNLRDSVCCRYPAELKGLNVCLVDDIVTTGATLSECALAMGRAGAKPATIGALTLGAPL